MGIPPRYLDENPVALLEVPSAEPKEILVTRTEYESIASGSRDPSSTDLVEVTWKIGADHRSCCVSKAANPHAQAQPHSTQSRDEFETIQAHQ